VNRKARRGSGLANAPGVGSVILLVRHPENSEESMPEVGDRCR